MGLRIISGRRSTLQISLTQLRLTCNGIRFNALILQHESLIFQPVKFMREDKQTEKGRKRYRGGKSVTKSFGAQLQRGKGEQQVRDKKACGNDQHFAAGVEIKKHVENRHQQDLHADRDDINVKQMDVKRRNADRMQ